MTCFTIKYIVIYRSTTPNRRSSELDTPTPLEISVSTTLLRSTSLSLNLQVFHQTHKVFHPIHMVFHLHLRY